jgi:hypothetical protein
VSTAEKHIACTAILSWEATCTGIRTAPADAENAMPFTSDSVALRGSKMPNELAVARPAGMELLAELSRKVNDPQAAIEIARQIVELEIRHEAFLQDRERFEWQKLDREARVAFTQAFQTFKESVPKIFKTKHVNFLNKTGGTTDYWHVELDKACDLLTPALLKVDITHHWKSADLPGGMTRVTCFLRHRLGHEHEGASLAGPADQSGGKNPIQGVGSSTSYLERYTFLATCGIVPSDKDNDGNETDKRVASVLGDQQFIALRDNIDNANNEEELKRFYLAAQKAAADLGDTRSAVEFDQHKNKRFRELKGQSNAQSK